MRIALVCPYAWDRPGGVQSHVRSLAGVLRRRDHEVLVVAPKADPNSRGEEGTTLLGRAVGIPANGSVAPITFGPLAAAGVRSALKGFRPEVLHLHEPLIPSTSLHALMLSRTPALGTFHAASGSSAGYRVAGMVLERAVRRLAIRSAVSEAARALVMRYFPGTYEITPNGIDLEPFLKASPRARNAPQRSVLFLGRLEKRKGLEVLIRAAARTGHPPEITVAGEGPEETRCRALARDLGVPCEWRGEVATAELPRLYRSATVYCAPSLGGESFGIVLLEAMASGAPVICSDLDGYRMVGGDAVRLVPPGDHVALAGALDDVLGNERKQAALRRAGRERVKSFDWGALVEDVEELYLRATGHKGG
ncbi:MAG TPA: glycosyltransferase family 4 protein [Actinomycetota bacterium]|nr:glycosyltransferase family 4 protein [Actinomycetota bacterium]